MGAVMTGFGLIETTIAVLVAAVIYISLWFILALRWKRIDIVDSAWGLGFVYVAVLSLLLQPNVGIIQVIALGLVSTWGIRLFAHITARNIKKSEDVRYVAYREKWGAKFARKAYTNIYLVQAILIVLVSTPIIAIMNYPEASFNPIIVAGFVIWIIGLITEAVGDYQLRQFLKIRTKGAIMQTGLWKYSRHPNYFGEITCWWGAAIVALGLGAWWGAIGAATITYLIVKVSGLPPLEKRYAQDSAYQAYKKKTSVLIPLPRR